MACSAVFVLDLKGKAILMRDYRGDVPTAKAPEKFMNILNELEETSRLTPVIYDESERLTYMYVQHNNLYLMTVTKGNVNATATISFLHSLVEVFTQYFQALEEESLRDNFVIAYELLDEVWRPQCICNLSYLMEERSNLMEERSDGGEEKSNLHCCGQMMDFGYPQFTESKILQEYIKTDAYKMEVWRCGPNPTEAYRPKVCRCPDILASASSCQWFTG